jgi:hypothetical protein
MDCREFRNKHVPFVDDVLPAYDMTAMERHRSACPRCSRQDTVVRRSLLLVRNLRPIEPSPEFMSRLNARLQELGPASRDDFVPSREFGPSRGAVVALAAGVLAVAYMAVETTHYFAPAVPLHMTPVVASMGDSAAEPMANAAFVASVPTGIPVWPAVLMVGQTPMQFASMNFGDIERGR